MPARPYIDTQTLWSTVTTDAGTLAILPTSATTVYFDAAKGNHIPRFADTGDHGSTILDVGRGVYVRASGHAELVGDVWQLGTIYLDGRHGGDATDAQSARAHAVLQAMVETWTANNGPALERAETISRNNAAQRLEEMISEHIDALRILQRELRRCEVGKPYNAYPTLPTDRR